MAASGGRATKKASGSLNNVRPTPTSRAWVELSPIGDHRFQFSVWPPITYLPSQTGLIQHRCTSGFLTVAGEETCTSSQFSANRCFCVCARPNTREICRRNGLLGVGIWADGARTWTFNRVALTESTQSSRAEAAAGRSKSICDLV
jgi:hypothetical protein